MIATEEKAGLANFVSASFAHAYCSVLRNGVVTSAVPLHRPLPPLIPGPLPAPPASPLPHTFHKRQVHQFRRGFFPRHRLDPPIYYLAI
jgi:hypothetical protein